jgi:hypothetical protein
MIIWGGWNGSFLNDGSIYDPIADSWTATSTGTNVPSARDSHTAVWTGNQMIIWAGYFKGAAKNTGGVYWP